MRFRGILHLLMAGVLSHLRRIKPLFLRLRIRQVLHRLMQNIYEDRQTLLTAVNKEHMAKTGLRCLELHTQGIRVRHR